MGRLRLYYVTTIPMCFVSGLGVELQYMNSYSIHRCITVLEGMLFVLFIHVIILILLQSLMSCVLFVSMHVIS
jgi:hypothetical protein